MSEKNHNTDKNLDYLYLPFFKNGKGWDQSQASNIGALSKSFCKPAGNARAEETCF